MTKTAVILLNLGGPDSLKAVEPFLYNLFSDPAILRVTAFLRYPLAWLLARTRRREAREIYQHLGGKSPLLENTQAQAAQLEKSLGIDYKVFIAMRYWHPLTAETWQAVKAYAPSQIILLPLYPQFSTTTTASSVKKWQEIVDQQVSAVSQSIPTTVVGCYPVLQEFTTTVARLIDEQLAVTDDLARTHVLFSAHGLPESIVQQGDPYPQQVQQTVDAVMDALNIKPSSYSLAYQSRVGPVRWIAPYTDQVIQQKGEEKKNLVLVPIAFVSEHSETLFEMDSQYKDLAFASGVPQFKRVPTVSVQETFIQGLAQLCKTAPTSSGKSIYCPCFLSPCVCQSFLK